VTKKRDVEKLIRRAAKKAGLTWVLDREGGNHEVYSLGGLMIPIPRHNEIDNRLAHAIYKECEPKLGEGWWRQ
jgi:hypothetical protein